ncbi:unnamed protein product [Paramecium sonneborni]|uniref:Uncharacterized protein n=1 Tax=Paramecium sonneborni TaxID=65129 RepID=A0A8S1NNI0_9CILI|nr:unnamed protein product [Paramecium sonneborni]
MEYQRIFLNANQRKRNQNLQSNHLDDVFEQCEDGTPYGSYLQKRIGLDLSEDSNQAKKVQTKFDLTNLKQNCFSQSQIKNISYSEQNKTQNQNLELELTNLNNHFQTNMINSEDITVLEVDEINYLEQNCSPNKKKIKTKYSQKISKNIRKIII